MKYIIASGTPFEIGLAHGTQAREEVLVSLHTYKTLFNHYGGLTWEEAICRAKKFEAAIAAFDADFIEEMRGVAEGAGVKYEDILTLNVRSEILFAAPPAPEGCTAVAICPERTAEHHMLHGQTWDWIPFQEPAMCVIKIIQRGKPNILMLTEGGIIGKIGLNSCGMGVTLNAMSVPGSAAGGIPLHILLRAILNATGYVDAMKKCIKGHCACAANIMLSLRDGEALDLELVPGDYDVFYAEEGYMVHTNHLCSERLRAAYKDLNRESAPSTHLRYGKADKIVRGAKEKFDAQKLWELFCDHNGYPDSICYHPDMLLSANVRGSTVATIVMDVTRLEMLASVGRPCENPPTLYKL
ncbi:MAG: C45 family peptidase [Christensenellaceae bacterium]|jgi:isopenicillin-N N-acyltransferase-like protein|nr:C45 family peptidase [Christensenellaceae bacterium]